MHTPWRGGEARTEPPRALLAPQRSHGEIPCGHRFCYKCIKSSATQTANTCPVCRAPFRQIRTADGRSVKVRERRLDPDALDEYHDWEVRPPTRGEASAFKDRKMRSLIKEGSEACRDHRREHPGTRRVRACARCRGAHPRARGGRHSMALSTLPTPARRARRLKRKAATARTCAGTARARCRPSRRRAAGGCPLRRGRRGGSELAPREAGA